MSRFLRIIVSLVLLSSFGFAEEIYKQLGSYPLPGEGFWDYLTYDSEANRLFIAHGSSILVTDTEGRQLGTIPAEGAHGVALVQDKNLGFSTNGRAGTVTVFDLKSLKPLQEIKAGVNPDAIIFDPHSKHVVVMNGGSKDLMAIDTNLKKVIATIPLGGKLEFAAAGPGRIYVNVEDTGEIAVVDSKNWKAVDRWKLPDCEEPTGLAIDEKTETLFTVCSNAKMLVLNSKTGAVRATVNTGSGTDAAAFDPGTGYAFASNGGDGTLTIVRKSNSAFDVAQNVATMKSARTLALDSSSHRVFLVGADFNPPAEGQKRGTMKPGSFKLLVFGPAK